MHTHGQQMYLHILKMKEINGTTICVNETCQLLSMKQCNKS